MQPKKRAAPMPDDKKQRELTKKLHHELDHLRDKDELDYLTDRHIVHTGPEPIGKRIPRYFERLSWQVIYKIGKWVAVLVAAVKDILGEDTIEK